MLRVILIIIFTLTVQRGQSLFHNDSHDDVRHRSCRLRSIRQAEFHWDSPRRSMTESFVLDDVEYKLCKYHVTWDEALVFCSSQRSHLATLDSDEKTAFVVQAIASSSAVSEDYWIGARKLYDEPWSWNSNAMTISVEKNIIPHIPILYAGYESNGINCLVIDRTGHDKPIFVPRACNQRRGFICQRENDRTYDNKIRMVSASRVGDQEFRLYAGRATWAEAVVQCRQEGLQIGEVKTVKEARILAISMLRNRPEGIESAWIGGYTRKDDPETWRWLASGENIERTEMWRKNMSETHGGCLLLDRHVCETPIYVESYCDRKRDVLCQKPPKKVFEKVPTSVIVDGCPYWIGFHPLKWSDARRSCESFNSSLVVLNSPVTISHMMRLMLDNKAELRHIWTDGHRSKTTGQWKWSVNGETIPDFGKTFVPWCPDDDYHTTDNSCLNLDRENLDSPIVYGLSCREKQTYVCQPLIGDCVFPSTPKPLQDASEDIDKSSLILYEDTTTLPSSTVTAPYAIANHNYGVIQTPLHHEHGLRVDDSSLRKSADDHNANNSSSPQDFSQYLKHFSRFTLPQLPQFGIKVVSATETTTPNNPSFDVKKKTKKASQFFTTSSPYVSSSTIVSAASSSFSTSAKKHADARKLSKLSTKFTNVSNASNSSHDFVDVTISSIVSNPTEKSSKIIHSTNPGSSRVTSTSRSSSSSKKSSKSSKASTTISPLISEDLSSNPSTYYVTRTNKNSIKTTRDLNRSNSTRIPAPTTTTTTNSPDSSITKKESEKNSFVPKNSRKNSTFVSIRRQNSKIYTEPTTPYDAIDEDYYNDDKDDYSVNKKNVYDDVKDDDETDEYSDDYDTTVKTQTKKKPKQTSTASIRKNPTVRPKTQKVEDDDEEDDETTKSSMPMIEELSKNLKNALVDMMQNGIEKRKNDKSTTMIPTPEIERKSSKIENAAWIRESAYEDDSNRNQITAELNNLSLRPYYAFEGPMIMNLGKTVKTRDGTIDSGRDFTFIGKKSNDENYLNNRRKMFNNETRRRTNNEKSYDRNTGSSTLASGMPAIKPNDPNSLMQLGRYFKNTFSGLGRNNARPIDDRRPSIVNPAREEIAARNDQRRYGSMRRPYQQERGRGYPSSREEDYRGKGRILEKFRRPGNQRSDSNYYKGSRRLYPRGNYDLMASSPPREEGRNVGIPREEKSRLDISWPGKNSSGYENFDETIRAVSPRSFAYPIRTTRSFHEEIGPEKSQTIKRKAFPDFKLSKLVKEVKIDLDKKMLRTYLEGIARKISRQNVDSKDDWRSTWRQLLRQMILILNRMNINVNGDVMKLKFGKEDKNDKLSESLGKLREIAWKSGSRKQRKDSANVINSEKLKKVNESLQNNSKMENRRTDSKLNRQTSVVGSRTGNPAQINSEGRVKDVTSDNYGRIYDNAIKKGSSKEEIIGATILPGKSSSNREERVEIPNADSRGSFQPRYANFSGPQVPRRAQSMVPVARLSTVFGYRPLMPQLHHRIIFQPGWNQIRAKSASRETKLGPENLPKGTLSRIVGSDHKNEHFATNANDVSQNHKNLTNNPERIEKSLKTSLDRNTNFKTDDERIFNEKNGNMHSGVNRETGISFKNDFVAKEHNKFEVIDANRRDEVSETYENANVASRNNVKQNGGNRIENKDANGNKNSSYVNDSTDRRENENEEKIVDEGKEELKRSEDYERKPIWSPVHRLTKAMELSVLRKFGGNPGNSLQSKNLVTRSANKIEDSSEKLKELEENIENANEEPSIVSLRMKMDEKKTSRISKRSKDFEIGDVDPRTIELSLQFLGNDENANERIYENSSINKTMDKTLSISPLNNRSVDGKNGTAMRDSRDRRSRNVGGTKKNTSNEKSSRDVDEANHYIATLLRTFDKNDSTNRRRSGSEKGGKSYVRKSAIDWGEQASSVFADLQESNDDLTLYIDLTLARVGSKPPNGRARSKG